MYKHTFTTQRPYLVQPCFGFMNKNTSRFTTFCFVHKKSHYKLVTWKPDLPERAENKRDIWQKDKGLNPNGNKQKTGLFRAHSPWLSVYWPTPKIPVKTQAEFFLLPKTPLECFLTADYDTELDADIHERHTVSSRGLKGMSTSFMSHQSSSSHSKLFSPNLVRSQNKPNKNCLDWLKLASYLSPGNTHLSQGCSSSPGLPPQRSA